MGNSGSFKETPNTDSSSLTIYQIDKIIEQMKKSIFKIYEKNEQNKVETKKGENEEPKGTGFLCLIPNPNIITSPLKVLITCYHVYRDLKEKNKINLIFENGTKKSLILDESRRIYTNEEYDTIIIELKENEFDLNNFLKIDNDIYKIKDLNNIYKNRKIYIIHYAKGEGAQYSIGTIIENKIDDNNEKNNIKYNEIYHNCSTESGSSGSPILNLKNFEVIGIHRGKKSNSSKGTLIKFPIDDFNKKNKTMKNLDIIIKKEILKL